MRAALALTLACMLNSCMLLPEDHLLRTKLSQSFARLQNAVDPRPWVEDAVRRLPLMVDRAQSMAPWSDDAVRRVQQIPGWVAEHVVEPAIEGPHRAVATATTALDQNLSDFASMTDEDSTLRRITSPTKAAQRMRHAVDQVPEVLGLHRQVLPSPTDLDRQTGTSPATRRETWIERILRRLPL